MNNKIPKWINDFALDIYKLIKKYDAMPRFQEMVNEWAEERKAEINKHRKWQDRRHHHFKENIARNPRLQKEEDVPPEEGWVFDTHVLHTSEKTESGMEHTSKIVSAWVPQELSISKEPNITHILPLANDRELTVAEKYTLLAAIYDVGRQGTEEIIPWTWPGPDKWDAPDALSNAKKCIFFEGIRRLVCDITSNEKDWLSVFLDQIENDLKSKTLSTKFAAQDATIPKPDADIHRKNFNVPHVFISYAREDKQWLVDILNGINPLIRQNKIYVWTDENIKPGDKWEKEIQVAISDAKVALLLVSRDYLASEFINETELPYILKADSQERLKILWVLVGDCMWKETKLKPIHSAIDPAEPLNTLSDGQKDKAIRKVCEAIQNAVLK